MDLARDRYWFEGAQEHAMKILSTLQGMTVTQALNVLNGDAVLSGVDSTDSSIIYQEVEDKEFKTKLAAHLKGLADVKAKAEAKEKAEREKAEKRHESDQEASERRSFYMQPLPKLPEMFIDKSVEKTSLGGKYTVPTNILKKYIQLYVTHHFMMQTDPYRLMLENQFLMQLHEKLRKAVGLEGFWGRDAGSNEPDAFDKALQEVCWEAIKKDGRYGQERRLERAGIKPTEKTFGGD